ncbi:terminase small subunit [Pseudooceanicola marinus]|nr:terminase small subunit [Pseudooceanicola marinus]
MEAAIRAGYSEKTAHSQGPRLLENVDIDSAIAVAEAVGSEQTGRTWE